MNEITIDEIRKSFINASKKDIASINFPQKDATAWLTSQNWSELEFLGWWDPKLPQRAYLVIPAERGLTGVLLRCPDGGSGKQRKIICELCHDVRCAHPVYLFVAKRAGSAGRAGNTVGTLICAGFECSANVRAELPPSQRPLDGEDANARLIISLRARLAEFVQRVCR